MAVSEPRQLVMSGLLSPTIEVIDPELPAPKVILAHKRVRPTSTGQYAALKDSGTLGPRRTAVLNAVAAFKNRRLFWPIADEIQAWMIEHGALRPTDTNPNIVRPRLTELSSGWFETPVRTCSETTASGAPCKASAFKNGKCRVHGGDEKRDPVFVPCSLLVGAGTRANANGIQMTVWAVRGVGA